MNQAHRNSNLLTRLLFHLHFSTSEDFARHEPLVVMVKSVVLARLLRCSTKRVTETIQKLQEVGLVEQYQFLLTKHHLFKLKAPVSTNPLSLASEEALGLFVGDEDEP